jgi:pyruvyltransferase
MRSNRDYDQRLDTVDLDEKYCCRPLFWSWYEPRNFGDWVAPYLFEAMCSFVPKHCPVAFMENQCPIFSAGSIMRHIRIAHRAIVWGSGIISANDHFEMPLEIRAVRGPKTRQRCLDLGYECPEIYGDPAILLPKYFQPQDVVTKRGLAVIPHFVDLERVQAVVGKDVRVIDVTQPVEQVINELAASEVVFSSSLHGLIVAHAYRIPAVWIASGTLLAGDGIKFLDYFASVNCSAEQCEVLEWSEPYLQRLAGKAICPDQRQLHEALEATCPFGE